MLVLLNSKATKARALELADGVKEFLRCFLDSSLPGSWSQHPSVAPFVVEIENLKRVVDAACTSEAIHADEIDTLKAARMSLLHRKAALHECMTMFPLGQFIQQMCNVGLEAYHRDKALAGDLDSCVAACAQMKSFSVDMLLKGEAPEITIQVPGQAKLSEVVQKMNMIQNTASQGFMNEFASQMTLVEIKLQEVKSALAQACARKFQLTCGDQLLVVLNTVLTENLTPDVTANLIEKVNLAKAFMPCSQQVLQKCIGVQSQELISIVTNVREFFGAFAAALPGLVALLQAAGDAAQFAPSRLIHAEMTKFLDAWSMLPKGLHCRRWCPILSRSFLLFYRRLARMPCHLNPLESLERLEFWNSSQIVRIVVVCRFVKKAFGDTLSDFVFYCT